MISTPVVAIVPRCRIENISFSSVVLSKQEAIGDSKLNQSKQGMVKYSNIPIFLDREERKTIGGVAIWKNSFSRPLRDEVTIINIERTYVIQQSYFVAHTAALRRKIVKFGNVMFLVGSMV